MIVLRNLLISCLATLVLISPLAEADSLINVPLNPNLSDFNRETYRFIHRLLNRRVIPGIRRGSLPFTRKQVVSYLLEAKRKQQSGEITLSPIDQQRLNALLIFYREAQLTTARSSDDAAAQSPIGRRLHVMTTAGTKAGKNYRFSFDVRASQHAITHLVDNLSGEQPVEGNMFVTTVYPQVYGQVGETFAFTTDTAQRFVYGEHFDDFFPDEAKTNFGESKDKLKNRTAINAYLKFNLPWFELQLGQETLQWGTRLSR